MFDKNDRLLKPVGSDRSAIPCLVCKTKGVVVHILNQDAKLRFNYNNLALEPWSSGYGMRLAI